MLSIVHAARKGEFACTSDVTYGLFSRLAELAQSESIKCLQTSRLTIRQRQVLALLTQGLSNKEIGDSLGVSAVTIKNHVHHLLTKIGARDRRVAARLPQLTAKPKGCSGVKESNPPHEDCKQDPGFTRVNEDRLARHASNVLREIYATKFDFWYPINCAAQNALSV